MQNKLPVTGFRIYLIVFVITVAVFSGPVTEKISIPHSAGGKSFKALVVLPGVYANNKNRFPALYLLHGYSGNHTSFSQICDLERYADSFTVILICLDGNYNSWYLNSPIKKSSQFDSYITQDVIPYIDNNYRTIASLKGRVIIGSSMGGHGALTLLAEHPDLFRGAGSISGILDLTAFPDEWDISRVLGPYSSNKNRWQQHSFLYIMEKLTDKKKVIIIDCGTSDFALSVNRAAHKKMENLTIAHEYHERPGGHSYKYIQKVLGYHLAYFSRLMNKK